MKKVAILGKEIMKMVETNSSYKQGSKMGWQKLFRELRIEQMLKHRRGKGKWRRGRQVEMRRWKKIG